MTELENRGLPDEKPLEQVAYEAYADHADWRSVHGEPLPQWGDHDPLVQSHWCAAAQAVFGAVQAGFEDRLRGLQS